MSRQDRRIAIIAAVITAVGGIAGALIGYWKKEPARPPTIQKTENKADTKGAQSPAVAGAKDVTVTYGQPQSKPKK